MALEKLILYPEQISGSGITSFTYMYVDPHRSKQVNFLITGEEYEGSLFGGGGIPKQEKRINFSATNTRYILEYDPKDERSPLFAEAKFILSHPNVFNKSTREQHKNYSGNAMFIVELEKQGMQEDFELTLKRTSAIMRFISLDPEQWRDVAFRFSLNPVGMTPFEVANILCSHQTSPILKSPDVIDEFLAWSRDIVSDSPRLLTEKAIALNVISKSGGVYKLDSMPVGATVDEVSNHLTQDGNSLMHVKVLVSQQDKDLHRYKESLKETEALKDGKSTLKTVLSDSGLNDILFPLKVKTDDDTPESIDEYKDESYANADAEVNNSKETTPKITPQKSNKKTASIKA